MDMFGNPSPEDTQNDEPQTNDEVEALRAQLAEEKAAREAAEAGREDMNVRLARLEGRLEAQPTVQAEPEPSWPRPSDEAGWTWARQTAALAVQADPSRAQAQREVEAEYEKWKESERETRTTRRYETDRFEDKLRDAGVKKGDPLYSHAEAVFKSGGDIDQFLSDVVDPLRTRVVEEANDNANQDTSEELAARTAIEEQGASPTPKDPAKSKSSDVSTEVSRSVGNLFQRAAHSSAKVFPK